MRGQQTNITLSEVDWRALKSLWPYLFEYKTHLTLALACLVGAKVASVGMPFILKHIVDTLDKQGDVAQLIAVPLGLLIAYGVVRFMSVLFGELRDTLFGRITERAMRRVGLKVFEHLHCLNLDFHLNRRTGGLSSDIERGVKGINFLMRFMVFNIVPTLLEILLIAGLLWWNYHAGYALIVLLSVVVYIGFSVVATEWRTRYVRIANRAESEANTRAIDSLLNYETVKYFTNEGHEATQYDQALDTWEQATRRNRLTLFGLNGGQAFIIAAAMSGAMILAAYEVASGAMTLGDFVLINAFMMQIFLPLNFLGFVYREMKGSLANIERMFALLDVAPTVTDKPDALSPSISRGEVVCRDVHFHYQPERAILKGINFTVSPRQTVAIVGASGAGKSTLFKLLFRFYDTTQGQILIDGIDVRDMTQRSLRHAISVVPQDTVLFNASILENVRYGRVEATDAEVAEALRIAHLDAFIQQLPDGWHTHVGERGLKLSGGEKQRVAIARAILKRPSIMVFDEATSSLDSQSERGILQALREVSQEQTTLMIAHRLSTVVDADCIIVLEQGQVVEQGSHQALLAENGHYARLWRLQQRERL